MNSASVQSPELTPASIIDRLLQITTADTYGPSPPGSEDSQKKHTTLHNQHQDFSQRTDLASNRGSLHTPQIEKLRQLVQEKRKQEVTAKHAQKPNQHKMPSINLLPFFRGINAHPKNVPQINNNNFVNKLINANALGHTQQHEAQQQQQQREKQRQLQHQQQPKQKQQINSIARQNEANQIAQMKNNPPNRFADLLQKLGRGNLNAQQRSVFKKLLNNPKVDPNLLLSQGYWTLPHKLGEHFNPKSPQQGYIEHYDYPGKMYKTLSLPVQNVAVQNEPQWDYSRNLPSKPPFPYMDTINGQLAEKHQAMERKKNYRPVSMQNLAKSAPGGLLWKRVTMSDPDKVYLTPAGKDKSLFHQLQPVRQVYLDNSRYVVQGRGSNLAPVGGSPNHNNLFVSIKRKRRSYDDEPTATQNANGGIHVVTGKVQNDMMTKGDSSNKKRSPRVRRSSEPIDVADLVNERILDGNSVPTNSALSKPTKKDIEALGFDPVDLEHESVHKRDAWNGDRYEQTEAQTSILESLTDDPGLSDSTGSDVDTDTLPTSDAVISHSNSEIKSNRSNIQGGMTNSNQLDESSTVNLVGHATVTEMSRPNVIKPTEKYNSGISSNNHKLRIIEKYFYKPNQEKDYTDLQGYSPTVSKQTDPSVKVIEKPVIIDISGPSPRVINRTSLESGKFHKANSSVQGTSFDLAQNNNGNGLLSPSSHTEGHIDNPNVNVAADAFVRHGGPENPYINSQVKTNVEINAIHGSSENSTPSPESSPPEQASISEQTPPQYNPTQQSELTQPTKPEEINIPEPSSIKETVHPESSSPVVIPPQILPPIPATHETAASPAQPIPPSELNPELNPQKPFPVEQQHQATTSPPLQVTPVITDKQPPIQVSSVPPVKDLEPKPTLTINKPSSLPSPSAANEKTEEDYFNQFGVAVKQPVQPVQPTPQTQKPVNQGKIVSIHLSNNSETLGHARPAATPPPQDQQQVGTLVLQNPAVDESLENAQKLGTESKVAEDMVFDYDKKNSKERASMFGGDILLSADIIEELAQYSKVQKEFPTPQEIKVRSC